jgi:uncharacterized membrane protein YvlD (DUF360 family)
MTISQIAATYILALLALLAIFLRSQSRRLTPATTRGIAALILVCLGALIRPVSPSTAPFGTALLTVGFLLPLLPSKKLRA